MKNQKLTMEALLLQKRAGIINESEYNKLLENTYILDKLLDKISSQGIQSLSQDEKEYLDRYSKGEKNLSEPAEGSTEVFASNSELYKVNNFPAIKNAENIELPCDGYDEDEEDEDGECDMDEIDKLRKLISNKKIEEIFHKIQNDYYSDEGGKTLGIGFHEIEFEGDFSSPLKTAYLAVAGDGTLTIVDSLNQFDDDYQTEKGWGVTTWNKI
jgi:hypothetical protein